jgi:DNA-binding NarL/FixJ family response regulator
MGEHDAPFSSAAAITRRVRTVRVVIVDDHRLLAQMLVDGLNELGYVAMSVDVAESDIPQRVVGLSPDLLILDAVFHDDEAGGLTVLQQLKRLGAPFGVVMLTGVADEIRHAEFLAAGAQAVISKSDSFDVVLGQIKDVLSGSDPMGANRREVLARALAERDARGANQTSVLDVLTDRELATLQALVDGKTVDEIAVVRTVATSTVRSQVRSVLSKLDAHSQIEAVAIAARSGMRPSVRDQEVEGR